MTWGEQAWGRLSGVEATLVPLYLHHRYQVEATASAVGGVEYTYTVRGDGLEPFRRVSAEAQRSALDALMRTLAPAELTLSDRVLRAIPPRPSRAARLVEQHTLDASLPGLEEFLGGSFEASSGASANTAYEAAVKRVVEGVVVERTMWLTANAPLRARRWKLHALQR